MPPVGFEPTISAGERPRTYAFDRAATGTGIKTMVWILILYGTTFLRSEQSYRIFSSLCEQMQKY